jgi:hypothetical protein
MILEKELSYKIWGAAAKTLRVLRVLRGEYKRKDKL